MSSVIIESRIRRGEKAHQWVVTEVSFTPGEGGVNLERPVVLSVTGFQKIRLESVFWALMDSRGKYFHQVMAAVTSREEAM